MKFLQDQLALQQDLNNLLTWGGKLQMSFDFVKCHFMSIGCSCSLFSCVMKIPDSQVVILAGASEERGLGVLFKTMLSLGYCERSYSFLEPSMFRVLYTSLIDPHLDYASVVLCPYQLGDIHLVEKTR